MISRACAPEAAPLFCAHPRTGSAGQARDFQTEHKADTGERHLGSEPGKAGAGRGSAARQTQVLMNYDDPFGGPAEFAGLAGERVLPLSRFDSILGVTAGYGGTL